MTYPVAKFKDSVSNTSSHFALFPGNKVKVQSVLDKFDALLVEVELENAEAGSHAVLDADGNGYSMQSFKPAREHTYNIVSKPTAGELVYDNHLMLNSPAQSSSPFKAASKA